MVGSMFVCGDCSYADGEERGKGGRDVGLFVVNAMSEKKRHCWILLLGQVNWLCCQGWAFMKQRGSRLLQGLVWVHWMSSTSPFLPPLRSHVKGCCTLM